MAMVTAGRWALATSLLLPVACSAESPTTPGSEAAPSEVAKAAGAGSDAVQATCVVDAALDAAVRKAVTEQATDLLIKLRQGDTQGLWKQLHPQAQRDDQREAFLGALGSMAERLADTSGAPTLERVGLVSLSGGANGVAVVKCGADDDPQRFTVLTNAGGEDVAIVAMQLSGASGSFAATIQLRKRGSAWRLLGLHASPRTYRGKDAAYYERLADGSMKQQRVVEAHLLLHLAKLLSDRGASVKTDVHDRVTQKLGAIERDQLFAAEMGTWTLGDARFRIQGLSLVAAADGMTPVFEYVSPQGLVKDLLDRDADLLLGEVQRRFAGLERYFDAVVFEAYAQVPNEPGKSYEAYRVVRFLDPAKRRG